MEATTPPAFPARSNPRSPDPCRLFALPQELQDIIFELAHSAPQDSSIVFGGHQPHAHKVDDWLVSRQYFLAAARVYLTSTRCRGVARSLFWVPDPSMPTAKTGRSIFKENLVRGQFGLVLQFGTVLDVNFTWPEHALSDVRFEGFPDVPGRWRCLIQTINKCYELEVLKVQIDATFFTPGCVYTQQLSDAKLVRCLKRNGLHKARGLKRVVFTLSSASLRVRRSAGDLVSQGQNLDRLNRVVQQMLFPERCAEVLDCCRSAEDRQALYVGSKVPLYAQREPDPGQEDNRLASPLVASSLTRTLEHANEETGDGETGAELTRAVPKDGVGQVEAASQEKLAGGTARKCKLQHAGVKLPVRTRQSVRQPDMKRPEGLRQAARNSATTALTEEAAGTGRQAVKKQTTTQGVEDEVEQIIGQLSRLSIRPADAMSPK